MNVIPEKVANSHIYDRQVQIFKVLMHPARLAILDILRDGDHCVCHMEAHLGYRQAYISQQLAVLREAGLIQDCREGWNIFYHVTDRRIYAVIDAVREISGPFEIKLQDAGVSCNCPKCSGRV